MIDGAQQLRVQRTAGTVRLTLSRPERRNALDTALWQALKRVLEEVHASAASVLVIEGEGGAFSAGADLAELRELLGDAAALAANTNLVQSTQQTLARLPQTTLALIDGDCIGGGLGLALACDLRIATTGSRFALTPAKLGLVYSPDDARRLVGVVGPARARRMLLCAQTLDAAEALAAGLVHEVVAEGALDAAAMRMLETLAQTSPQARVGLKTVLAHVAGDPGVDAAAAARAFTESFCSADFAEGAAAFLARRCPRFPSAEP